MAVNQKMIFVYDDFSTDQSVLMSCLSMWMRKITESVLIWQCRPL